jgi:hypothetical protein
MTQTMGFTDAQVSDSYVFPHYDYTDATRYNSLQLANFDSKDTEIIVKIGGVERGRFPVGVGGSQNVTFSGVAGGPVEVSSNNGAKIVVSLYELKKDGANATTGEMDGANADDGAAGVAVVGHVHHPATRYIASVCPDTPLLQDTLPAATTFICIYQGMAFAIFSPFRKRGNSQPNGEENIMKNRICLETISG